MPMNSGFQTIMKQKEEEKRKHVLEVGENAFSRSSKTRFCFTDIAFSIFSGSISVPPQKHQRFTSKVTAF
jgi:hypothetical protein